MILERTRAVQAWQELMGLGDDDDAADQSIDADISVEAIRRSLRSTKMSSGMPSGPKMRETYGKGLLYGSRSDSQAQRQIAICAPDFATAQAMEDLSVEYAQRADEEEEAANQSYDPPTEAEESLGTLEVHTNDVAAAEEDGCVVVDESSLVFNEAGEAFDAKTGAEVALEEELLPTVGTTTSRDAPTGRKVFKARPIPASVATPKIQPRLSRAAALRMGVELPAVPVRKVAAAADQGPVGISGMPKADVAVPRSLAEPSIKPRANRASMARAGPGGMGASSASRTSSASPVRARKEVDFGNTPGHKRQSIGGASAIASLAKPTIAPRQNRASLARTGGPAPASQRAVGPRPSSSSTSAGSSSSPGKPSAPRQSFNLASLKPPTIAPRSNRAAVARGGVVAGDGSDEVVRSPSPNKENRPRSSLAMNGRASVVATARPSSPVKAETNRERRPVDFSATPGHKRASNSFSIAALAAPKIAPRSNLAASRRLSVGGVGVGATAAARVQNGNAAPSGHRPASSLSGAAMISSRPGVGRGAARPASSAGVRSSTANGAAHQDGHSPATAASALLHHQPLRARANPPSSFRVVGA